MERLMFYHQTDVIAFLFIGDGGLHCEAGEGKTESFTRMSKQILLDVSYSRQNQLKNKKQKLNLQ